jgi:hypothetical protein
MGDYKLPENSLDENKPALGPDMGPRYGRMKTSHPNFIDTNHLQRLIDDFPILLK